MPHSLLQIRGRYEALTSRALNVRTVEGPRAREEYDPDEYGVLDDEPLTAEEWAAVLAFGRAIARYYDRPATIDGAVRAGMSRRQVADALGEDTGRARALYRVWVAGQRQLNADQPGGTLGMTADQYAEAIALTPAPDPDDPGAAQDDRAAAVRELEAARGDRRAAEERTAVLGARAVQVPVRRTAEVAGISPDTVQRWTQAAAAGASGPSHARTLEPLPGEPLPGEPGAVIALDDARVVALARARQQLGSAGSDLPQPVPQPDAADWLRSVWRAAGHRAARPPASTSVTRRPAVGSRWLVAPRRGGPVLSRAIVHDAPKTASACVRHSVIPDPGRR
ncbi:hypothetical protein ACFOY4_30865 [Actinomadura syzygii]|uniref:Uncharacterized protein n=1 Tax=Actinomadura syzygii TaxID=1427538 RepID=A0A5D0TSN6_9ACTN|nr:hypothetical protein [Actinomadura syzygii]TYC08724.1 hypothetical protein FXF65_38270 [Actinomadura syzygii]